MNPDDAEVTPALTAVASLSISDPDDFANDMDDN